MSEVPSPPPAAADEPLRVEPFRFGELLETEAFCRRVDLSLQHVRSLRAHPYARPEDMAGLLLLRGDRCVGRYAFLPGRLRVGEQEFPIMWGSNWNVDMTDPRNRAGAGLMLLMATRGRGKNFMGSGPSEFSRPVFVAGKFQLRQVPRRAVLLRSRAFLARRLPAPALARPAALLLDPALRLIDRGRRLTRGLALGPRYRLERVERLDARLDEIDRAARSPCWFPRDHRELNWALQNPWLPADQYQLEAYYLMTSEGIAGYALARMRVFNGLRIGSVVRCAVRTELPGAADALLAALTDAFDEQRADIVDLSSSNPAILGAAKRLGMQPRGHSELVARFGPAISEALRQRNATLESFDAEMGEGDVIFA